jgi:hypothetical protein
MKRKTTDSTIEEIHRTRREISDRFEGDVFAIAEDAARRQAASNRPVWTPKHHEQTHPKKSSNGSLSDRESSAAAG